MKKSLNQRLYLFLYCDRSTNWIQALSVHDYEDSVFIYLNGFSPDPETLRAGHCTRSDCESCHPLEKPIWEETFSWSLRSSDSSHSNLQLFRFYFFVFDCHKDFDSFPLELKFIVDSAVAIFLLVDKDERNCLCFQNFCSLFHCLYYIIWHIIIWI